MASPAWPSAPPSAPPAAAPAGGVNQGLAPTVASTTAWRPPAEFDCQADVDGWEENWSEAKKAWCCTEESVGCATTPAPPATSAAPYDCGSLEAAVPDAKRAWCCQSAGRLCEMGPPTGTEPEVALPPAKPSPDQGSTAYSCRAEHGGAIVELWSSAHRSYCCTLEGIGCRESPSTTTKDPTTTTYGFDCAHGGPDTWSNEKEKYCCERWGLGCPLKRTSSGYAQSDALSRALGPSDGPSQLEGELRSERPAAATSASKPQTAAEDSDCGQGEVSAWSPQKQSFCCILQGKGCPEPGTAASDATAVTAGALTGGTVLEQKQEAATPTIDATASSTKPLTDEEKIAEIEAELEREVTTTTPYEPFDCQAGLAMSSLWWSNQKRDWCCKSHNVACPTTTSADAAPALRKGAEHATSHAESSSGESPEHPVSYRAGQDGVEFQKKVEATFLAGAEGADRPTAWRLVPSAAAFMGLVAAVAGFRALSSERRSVTSSYQTMSQAV